MVNFSLKLANIVLSINCFNETTKRYCKDFIVDEKPDLVISLTEEDIKNEVINSTNNQFYVDEEISALYRKIADTLIEKNIVVFHSSSFMVGDSAFLVTARSGVGKSTHVKLLKELLNEKMSYINDDKPLLEVKGDKIIIHSSPWNGKERRGSNVSAELKAIIFLSRGVDNTFEKIEDKNSIYFDLISQIYLPYEKAKREKALKIADKIKENINFYKIYVNKDISAAKMTYERIIKNEIK
ncbi:MAG: hypothetical protein J6X03_01485 [Bacilli bacterium]|nr:hypothetical protein [Bacilli bacterium]